VNGGTGNALDIVSARLVIRKDHQRDVRELLGSPGEGMAPAADPPNLIRSQLLATIGLLSTELALTASSAPARTDSLVTRSDLSAGVGVYYGPPR
jgi:hypothetical protein